MRFDDINFVQRAIKIITRLFYRREFNFDFTSELKKEQLKHIVTSFLLKQRIILNELRARDLYNIILLVVTLKYYMTMSQADYFSYIFMRIYETEQLEFLSNTNKLKLIIAIMDFCYAKKY